MKFDDFAAKLILESANKPDHLSSREKHLIGISVATTRGCIDCSGSRIRWALESGIPRAAIIQTIDIASAVNAGVTTKIALLGIAKEELNLGCLDGSCTVGL